MIVQPTIDDGQFAFFWVFFFFKPALVHSFVQPKSFSFYMNETTGFINLSLYVRVSDDHWEFMNRITE